MNKTIPYKETYLTFYHYKEPLKKVENGHGYQGALLGTIDGTKVQCHMCGDLWADLAKHVLMSHKKEVAGVREYKERFGLAFETALVSEEIRMLRKAESLKQWYSMSASEKETMRRKSREGYRKWLRENGRKFNQPKQQLETKNVRGTCPDQLLAKILACKEDIGYTPSKVDFIKWDNNSQRYVHLIYKTFGSWKEAVKKAGLTPKSIRQNGGKRNYSDEELLDSLSSFKDEFGKIPSASDCRRGFLLDYNIYVRRFGSFPNARKLAGITDRPTRWGVRSA